MQMRIHLITLPSSATTTSTIVIFIYLFFADAVAGDSAMVLSLEMNSVTIYYLISTDACTPNVPLKYNIFLSFLHRSPALSCSFPLSLSRSLSFRPASPATPAFLGSPNDIFSHWDFVCVFFFLVHFRSLHATVCITYEWPSIPHGDIAHDFSQFRHLMRLKIR